MMSKCKAKLLVLVLAGTQVAIAASGETAKSSMRAGIKYMDAEDFSSAAAEFVKAAELAPGQNLDPSPAWFNAGNAMYREQNFSAAAEHYSRAIVGEDLLLQSKAFYNLANIDLVRAEKAIERDGDAVAASEAYDSALSNYEQSILLDPDYLDAKFNYELAALRQARLFGFVSSLENELIRAREMARAREYQRAAEFLYINSENHRLAFQLEPELEERYQELLRRNRELADIIQRLEENADVL